MLQNLEEEEVMHIDRAGYYTIQHEPEVVVDTQEVMVDALSIGQLRVEDAAETHYRGFWLGSGSLEDNVDTSLRFGGLGGELEVEDSREVNLDFNLARRSEVELENSTEIEAEIGDFHDGLFSAHWVNELHVEMEHADSASFVFDEVEDVTVQVDRGATYTSLSGGEHVDIHTGSGDDYISTFMSRDVELETAAGNDGISLFGSEGVVDAGSGHDRLEFEYSRVAYTPGGGHDHVTVEGGTSFGYTADEQSDYVEFYLTGGGEHTLFADREDAVAVRDDHGNSWNPENLSKITPGAGVEIGAFMLDLEYI